MGEALLNRVMEDPSRYVQNSCANWLNDAGKTPAALGDWVLRTMAKPEPVRNADVCDSKSSEEYRITATCGAVYLRRSSQSVMLAKII